MKNNKSPFSLMLAIFFVAMGSYRLYQKFYLEEFVSNFQWIASIFLIAFGLYRLFQYFTTVKKRD